METGLFFLFGTLLLIAGILGVRFNKRIARLFFVTSVASFIVGVMIYLEESKAIKAVVADFESGKHIVCTVDATIYGVSKENGWELKGEEHFFKAETNMVIWAKSCKADK